MNNGQIFNNKAKRVKFFLAVAFAISWLTALVIYFNGGLVNSPELIPGTGITLALILLASVYMWGPAIAHIITRLVSKEGWSTAFLKPEIKTGWPWWLVGWFGPSLLVLVGALVYFVIFPASYDAQLTMLTNQLDLAGTSSESISPWQIVLLQTGVAMLISPLLNLVATFGEEFGWRAYLLPKLAEKGTRKALIISSLIWGVWHWPVILMGHNYGLGYWGYPWSGLLAMTWFCLSAGVFIGWVTLKAGSVWPAVFAHGALNGLAAIGMLFVKGQPEMLLGPTPAGIIGALPFTVISLAILLTIRDHLDSQPVE